MVRGSAPKSVASRDSATDSRTSIGPGLDWCLWGLLRVVVGSSFLFLVDLHIGPIFMDVLWSLVVA